MASKNCDICGAAAGLMKMTYPDGIVCNKCFSKANKQVARIYNSVVEVRSILEQDTSGMTPEEKSDLGKKLDEATQEKRAAEIQTKIRENNVQIKHVDNTPCCPKCRSTSISADKKGFGVGKAVAGVAFAGPVGLVAGNFGAKQVRITCLNCGHQWTAGKA